MWSVVRSLGDPARRSPLATPAGGGSVSEAAGDAFREPAPLGSSVSGHVVTSGALVALPTSRGALVLSPGSGRVAAGRVATPRSWPRATQLPCCVFLPGASARRTARPHAQGGGTVSPSAARVSRARPPRRRGVPPGAPEPSALLGSEGLSCPPGAPGPSVLLGPGPGTQGCGLVPAPQDAARRCAAAPSASRPLSFIPERLIREPRPSPVSRLHGR